MTLDFCVCIDLPEVHGIAVSRANYHGKDRRKLTVSFLERTPKDLAARILQHANAWGCGVQFVRAKGIGDVRITRRGQGYWSYLGSDIFRVPQHLPTMGLQGFSMATPESDFARVVQHEFGHTLGFPHEHMRAELVARIDPEKAYEFFSRTQGWDRATVDLQVLTPLGEASLFGTPPNQQSCMCYSLPGSITRDGEPILGGAGVTETDTAFARRIYPL